MATVPAVGGTHPWATMVLWLFSMTSPHHVRQMWFAGEMNGLWTPSPLPI